MPNPYMDALFRKAAVILTLDPGAIEGEDIVYKIAGDADLNAKREALKPLLPDGAAADPAVYDAAKRELRIRTADLDSARYIAGLSGAGNAAELGRVAACALALNKALMDKTARQLTAILNKAANPAPPMSLTAAEVAQAVSPKAAARPGAAPQRK